MVNQENKVTLKQLVAREGSVAAAARFLEMPYVSVYRWHVGETQPDDAHVKLLALKGVRP